MRQIVAFFFLIFRCSVAYDPWYYVEKEQTYAYACSDNQVVDYTCNCETEGRVLCTVENETKIENLDKNFLLPDKTKFLDLNNNEIIGIQRGTFNCAAPIEELLLGHNLISGIEPGAFVTFNSSLRILDLSWNRIDALEKGIFDGLENLISLQLAHNYLGAIDPEIFLNVPSLESLDISYSHKLGPFAANAFDNLPKLKYLDLTNTSQSELPESLFQNNSHLKELRLSKNPLTEVPTRALFKVRTTLTYLDLSATDLEEVENHSFHGLYGLRILILNDLPRLREIQSLSFDSLAELDTLEIQHNPRLVYIDPFAFYDNLHALRPHHVQRAFLAGNALGFVSASMLHWDEMEEVDLSGNPWNCDCNLKWVLEVRHELRSVDETACFLPPALTNTSFKDVRSSDMECEVRWSAAWVFEGLLFAGLIVVICVIAFIAYSCWAMKFDTYRIKEAFKWNNRSGSNYNLMSPSRQQSYADEMQPEPSSDRFHDILRENQADRDRHTERAGSFSEFEPQPPPI